MYTQMSLGKTDNVAMILIDYDNFYLFCFYLFITFSVKLPFAVYIVENLVYFIISFSWLSHSLMCAR